MQDGVLWTTGQPRFLLVGEYRYHQDDPPRWPARLAAMRAAGIQLVSCAVPWRHHELPDGDFALAGPGNRDLVGFLVAVQAAGLSALVCPGPFGPADLAFLGLPDRVSPGNDPQRQAQRGADGTPLRSDGLDLPSSRDPLFRADAEAWLAVVAHALLPLLHPLGPVVAVQVGHGGTGLPIDATDYSDSALRAFTAATGLVAPTDWPADGGLEPLLAWGEWSARAVGTAAVGYANALGLDLPVIAATGPPVARGAQPRDGVRHDAWLTRARLDRYDGLHHGHTGLTGDPVVDDAALLDHVLTVKRRRGPDLAAAATTGRGPVYQALLAVACGATGLTLSESAPTERHGRSLRVLAHFLRSQGSDLVRSRPEPGVTFGYYPPYAAIAAWQPPRPEPPGRLPPSAARTLVPFVDHCLRGGIPFSIHDLQRPELPPDPLVIASGSFMDAAAQHRLAAFARAGAPLLLIGEMPLLDEAFQPCTTLADAAVSVAPPPDPRDLGWLIDDWLGRTLGVRLPPPTGRLLELRLLGPYPDDHYVFLFSRTDHAQRVLTTVAGRPLGVELAPRCAAVVRIAAGRLRACYVQGVDEVRGVGVPVRVEYGRDRVTSDRPADLSAVPGRYGPLEIRTAP